MEGEKKAVSGRDDGTIGGAVFRVRTEPLSLPVIREFDAAVASVLQMGCKTSPLTVNSCRKVRMHFIVRVGCWALEK